MRNHAIWCLARKRRITHGRIIGCRWIALHRSVPAVATEAALARARHSGLRTVQASRYNSAADTGRPAWIRRAVAKRGDVHEVGDKCVAVGPAVRDLNCGGVGLGRVWCVRKIDNKRDGSVAGGHGGVAAEECRALIQA